MQQISSIMHLPFSEDRLQNLEYATAVGYAFLIGVFSFKFHSGWEGCHEEHVQAPLMVYSVK